LGQVGATGAGEEGFELLVLDAEVFVFSNESKSFHFYLFLVSLQSLRYLSSNFLGCLTHLIRAATVVWIIINIGMRIRTPIF
jgi:hypothetical protein